MSNFTQFLNQTMDSREIAKVTGKQHSHVLSDIKSMLNKLNLAESVFRSGYLDKNNQKRVCFILPFFETTILTSGYSVELRAKITQRWIDLELAAIALAAPATPVIKTRKVTPKLPILVAADIFVAIYKKLRAVKISKRASAAAANLAALAKTGEDFLVVTGFKHASKPDAAELDQEPLVLISNKTVSKEYFLVTDLGVTIGKSAQAINKALTSQGYQKRVNGKLVSTKQGEAYSHTDSFTVNGGDTLVKQVTWDKDILDVLTF